MKAAVVATAALLGMATPSMAMDADFRLLGRGWFFGADGHVEDTDLDSLDFDSLKGQPEIEGGVVLGERHHLEVSYLFVRRSESGVAQGFILGILPVQDRVSIDLDLDYLRVHYGYSLLLGDWVDLKPFLELGYVKEESVVRNLTLGQSERQDESVVFPLPGVELVLGRTKPIRGRAKVGGITTGDDHLVDVEGALEASFGPVVGGVGYRHVDLEVETDGSQNVDVSLGGVFIEGGVRF